MIFVCLLLIGCTTEMRQPTQILTLSHNQVLQLQAAEVKGNIAGNIVTLFSYNNQIPGPLLKVKQNSTLLLNFTNNLNMPTSVHWHGIRVDNKNDGVPGLTQPEIQPGESFLYNLRFPDPGIYWYHPHSREDLQQEMGLSGNIFAQPIEEGYYNPVSREEFIMLDDILLDGAKASFTDKIDHTLMGRFGNHMLINGNDFVELQAKQGEVIRFFFTNAANARPFRITIPGASMKLVGMDAELSEHEEFVDEIVLAPSKRATVEVYLAQPGLYEIKNSNPQQEYVLGKIQVSSIKTDIDYSSRFKQLQEHSSMQEQLKHFKSYLNTQPDEELILSLDMPLMQHMGPMRLVRDSEGIEWEDTMGMMNRYTTEDSLQWNIIDAKTGKKNKDIHLRWKVGDKVKLRISNPLNATHPMQHPIHLHGQRFVVLSTNGIENQNLAFEDTVFVKAGDIIDILVDVTNPGTWMGHCHIAEHLMDGMMFHFEVSP